VPDVPVGGGVTLHVEDVPGPAGRVLLVVHGGPDWDCSYLREPLVELADRTRVLLVDLRGCGRSTRGLPEDRYTWDAAAGDLVALLDRMDLPAVDVLGFSAGGRVAQRLTLAAPQRVRRLVVASSSVEPVPDDAFAGWAERERRAATVAPLDRTLAGPAMTEAWARSSAPLNLWRLELLPDYLRRLDEIRWSAEWAGPWLAGRLPSALPEDATRRLAALGVPLLLLQGRQDMTFPAGLADRTAAAVPTAVARVLDQAGHMAHIDQPRAWLAALADFLG
jgi:pimeloyl-ACP methyl ester carboxylesterase